MIFLVLLYVVAVVSAKKVPPYSPSEGPQYFEDFIKTHNKVYSSDEEKAKRYQIFLKNLEEINQLNAKYEHTGFSVDQFTDLTLQELQARYKSLKGPADFFGGCSSIGLETKNKYEHLKVPILNMSHHNFDWRERRVVTRVKNEGFCGASWAFSAVGNVESVNALETGILRELSVQQLVDCDSTNDGCRGGDPLRAIEYMTRKGVMYSEDYSYAAQDESCRYKKELVGVRLLDCLLLKVEEHAVRDQLRVIGPLSIVLDVAGLRYYDSGVLTGERCHYTNTDINYAALLVGYGIDSDSGLPYWLLKGSWGENFGEGGYFRIRRGMNCLGFNVSPPVTAIMNQPTPFPIKD